MVKNCFFLLSKFLGSSPKGDKVHLSHHLEPRLRGLKPQLRPTRPQLRFMERWGPHKSCARGTNQSPKGKMWSRFPFPAHLLIMKCLGGSRATGPNASKSCRTKEIPVRSCPFSLSLALESLSPALEGLSQALE